MNDITTTLEIEYAIIGACLADPEIAKSTIALGVESSWFYDPKHAAIFGALRCSEAKNIIETKAILRAEQSEDLADSLLTLVNAGCIESQVPWHVSKLREAHERRQIYRLGLEISEKASEGDLETIKASVRERLDQIGVERRGEAYSVKGWGEVAQIELKPQGWFWGETFALGQLQAILGQGGLGKSRIALNLARNQVLSIPFAGMATGERPYRHLLMGSENNIHRLQYDVRRMSRGLDASDLAMLETHIFMATIESGEDGYISLESESNVRKWRATLKTFAPEVLWVDPYGDIHEGEANSDSDTRATIGKLSRLAREVNPNMAIVILHHARTGANNIAQAIGFDAANFGKGSKALYSSCRAVINLAPFDESENPPVLVACGKNNNARRFEPKKLVLDEQTMTYTEDNLDVGAWRADLQAAARGKRTVKASTPLESYHIAVVSILEGSGPMPHGKLFEALKTSTGLGDKRIDRLLSDCVFSGVIAKTPRLKERDGKVLYGTPKQVTATINPELRGVKS